MVGFMAVFSSVATLLASWSVATSAWSFCGDGAQGDVAVGEETGELLVLIGERLHDRVELHEDVVGLGLVLLVDLRHRA